MAQFERYMFLSFVGRISYIINVISAALALAR